MASPMMKVCAGDNILIKREETVQSAGGRCLWPCVITEKTSVLKEWLQELKDRGYGLPSAAAQPEEWADYDPYGAGTGEKDELILEALKRYETADV